MDSPVRFQIIMEGSFNFKMIWGFIKVLDVEEIVRNSQNCLEMSGRWSRICGEFSSTS
jgi:hypothetical protein